MHTHAAQQQISFKEFETPYQRRDPASTALYQAITKNLNTFLAYVEAERKKLPKHVVSEFDGFLRCGLLQYGFVRVKCQSCNFERIVAFSCKLRGFVQLEYSLPRLGAGGGILQDISRPTVLVGRRSDERRDPRHHKKYCGENRARAPAARSAPRKG